MTPIRSLLLLAAVFAAPVLAADKPPVTAARNDAAVEAFAKGMFLDSVVNLCIEQVPVVSVSLGEVADGWLERNTALFSAVNQWLDYAVVTAAAGDKAREEALTAEIVAVVESLHKQWAQAAFPDESLDGITCMQLAKAVEDGQYELLGNPQTSPMLREIAAIDWAAE